MIHTGEIIFLLPLPERLKHMVRYRIALLSCSKTLDHVLNLLGLLKPVLLYCWQRLMLHEKVLVFCIEGNIDCLLHTQVVRDVIQCSCQPATLGIIIILTVTTAITIMHVLLLDSCQYFPLFIGSCHILVISILKCVKKYCSSESL